ncbi:MAG: T9SS type A sorting domain-containing protein [Bacteroidales bacterium]|jgi:hypothetical protein
MKRIYLIITVLLLSNITFAQLSVEGTPKSFTHKDISLLLTATLDVTQPDLTKTIEEDNSVESMYKTRRFGVTIPIGVDFFKKADVVEVDNGKLWILKISCQEAQALVLYSDNFYLPKGGELYLYNNDHSKVIGAFTSINNHELKTFATELVYGDEMTMEYFQPNSVTEKAVIEISKLGYAYRDCAEDYSKSSSEYGSSGSCNVNVNCSEGDNYRNAQRGVVRIVIVSAYGMGWCSGSLVNNTSRDLSPYLLSAAHCVEDVTSSSYYSQFVFYFNYESTGCSATTEPTSRTLTGATLKAQAPSGSDFLLMRLNNTVPETYNAYWNGWNVGTTASTSGVAIHHPSGDIKKISTYTSAPVTSTYSDFSTGAHWLVQWVSTTNGNGITEGGSSGSPLFNSSSQIVGTLTGGQSSCSASTSNRNDYFGKMSYHWTSNGSTDALRLKPWLDPTSSGVTQMIGDDYTTLSSLKDIDSEAETLSSIYPNPATNDINISLTSQTTPINLTIYDELGRAFISQTIPANTKEYTISASTLKSGYYIVKFTSNNKTWNNKVVINK